MKKNKYLELARKACEIADSKKAVDPVILNVRRLTTLADYFLIVTAESTPQMNAITEAIYRQFRDTLSILPSHRDGRGSNRWSVIDYGGLVVHIMNAGMRKLYNLERIWDGAIKVKPTKANRQSLISKK